MYEFKTKPYPFQLEEFEDSRDKYKWALWWEQGVGKSKVVIDTTAYLFQKGEVDTAIIIAPEGVHSNWTDSYGDLKCQFEIHCPDSIFADTKLMTYHSAKSNTKKWARSANAFCAWDKYRVLAITYDGIKTKNGKKLVNYLLKKKKCIVISDETHKIKNPDTARAQELIGKGKKIQGLNKLPKYVRVLTGTLITQSAFDCYAPIKFMRDGYWKAFNLDSFWAFKHYFGEWKKRGKWKDGKPDMHPVTQKDASGRIRRNPDGSPVIKLEQKTFEDFVQYQNQKELQWHISKNGSRIRKKDVLKDLPPMTHKTLLVELSKEQRRIYNSLEKEFRAYIDGGIVEAQHVLTKYIKMHQAVQGFVVNEEDEIITIKDNPRFDALMDICETTEQQVLIWANFVHDIERIESYLQKLGKSVVSYYGGTKKDQRKINVEKYQSGKAQFFVSNPVVGGTGIDLYNTGIMIYYGHTYSLTDRLQSEERVARGGLKNPWLKIDMLSRDTNEHLILDALKRKENLSKFLMRDEIQTELFS